MATFKRFTPSGVAVTHDDAATTKRMLPSGEQLSVEAAAGGGGGFLPAWARQRSAVIGAGMR